MTAETNKENTSGAPQESKEALGLDSLLKELGLGENLGKLFQGLLAKIEPFLAKLGIIKGKEAVDKGTDNVAATGAKTTEKATSNVKEAPKKTMDKAQAGKEVVLAALEAPERLLIGASNFASTWYHGLANEKHGVGTDKLAGFGSVSKGGWSSKQLFERLLGLSLSGDNNNSKFAKALEQSEVKEVLVLFFSNDRPPKNRPKTKEEFMQTDDYKRLKVIHDVCVAKGKKPVICTPVAFGYSAMFKDPDKLVEKQQWHMELAGFIKELFPYLDFNRGNQLSEHQEKRKSAGLHMGGPQLANIVKSRIDGGKQQPENLA